MIEYDEDIESYESDCGHAGPYGCGQCDACEQDADATYDSTEDYDARH